MEAIVRGEGFDAKDGAGSIKSARTHAKAMWSKLVEADNVAASLMIAGRDFLDSQLHMVQGVRWEAGTLVYSDQQAVPGQVAKQWDLWDRPSRNCLDILRLTEQGTDSISASATPRLYTVEGVNVLVELLTVRKLQLAQHPEDAADKDKFGKAIVSADHQIDVLTHRLWTVQNRFLEDTQAQEIDRRLEDMKKQPGPRNPDKTGAPGTFTINPDDDLHAALYISARDEARELERWKREWEELGSAVRGQIEEAGDKRSRLRQLQGTLPELVHQEYQEWLRDDREAMGQRLRYPFLCRYLQGAWDGEAIAQFDFEEFYEMKSVASEGVPPQHLLGPS